MSCALVCAIFQFISSSFSIDSRSACFISPTALYYRRPGLAWSDHLLRLLQPKTRPFGVVVKNAKTKRRICKPGDIHALFVGGSISTSNIRAGWRDEEAVVSSCGGEETSLLYIVRVGNYIEGYIECVLSCVIRKPDFSGVHTAKWSCEC